MRGAGHPRIGMHRHVVLTQPLAPPVQVGMEVLLGEEAGLAVVASLHDVQRNAVEQDDWAVGHGGKVRGRKG